MASLPPATAFALLLALTYFGAVVLGLALERIRVPWMFGALVLGLGLAAFQPFPSASGSQAFEFLSEWGAYAFLFVVGMRISLEDISKNGGFVLGTAVAVVTAEAAAGAVLIHLMFGTPWPIAGLVGLSFATVGEAILVPILQEFGLIRTRFGQTLLGIGFVDDLFEVLSIIILVVVLVAGGTSGSAGEGRVLSASPEHLRLWPALLALGGLVALVALARWGVGMRTWARASRLRVPRPGELRVAGAMFALFAFVALATFSEAGPLAALLAGVATRYALPPARREPTTDDVQTLTYAVLGPPFFLSVGLETDVRQLVHSPLPLLALVFTVNAVKIGVSLLAGGRKLGMQRALTMGVALTVKFSTSIVVLRVLLDMGKIGRPLFSTLIGAKVALFAVPPVLSWLLKRLPAQEAASSS